MQISIRTWKENKDSVSVNYGPLTLSLKIEEQYRAVPSEKTAIDDSRWQPTADARNWPSYEILPGSPWNYALLIDKVTPARSFEVIRKPWPANNQPFVSSDAPIELRAKGRLLPRWTLDSHGLAGALPQSPVDTIEPMVSLTLVPMGAARLRLSAFPVAVR